MNGPRVCRRYVLLEVLESDTDQVESLQTIIRGITELEDGIIAIAKNKFKIFFDPAKKRENWWGYDITVKSTIPEDRVRKGIKATGYLENCKIIEHDEEE